MTAPAHIGLRLYREREDQGWTLKQSAAASGVSYATVMRAEQGHDVCVSSVLALARAYRLSLDVLAAEPACSRCLDRGCPECASNGKNGNDEGERP